jgi:MFS transporter, DHA1 family, tetracycline resistance protein
VLPSFSKELGASNMEVGGIAAVHSLMNFLFAPWWGMLSDKHGRRPIILISIAVTGCSYLLLGFSSMLVVLFLSRMFSGIGSANISVAQAYLSDITPPQDRAKAMGMIGAAFGLGFIFGPVIGGLVADHYGTAALGFMAASFSAINLVMAWLMLPESLKVTNPLSRPRLFKFKPLLAALQREYISSLMIVGFIYITAFAMMQITAVLLWQEHYHITKKEVGYLFAVIGLASAVVQGGLVGKLQRAWGEEKMLIVGLSAMVLGLLTIPFAPSAHLPFFVMQGLSMGLLAFGSGCAQPALSSLLSRLSGADEQGKILGINMSFGSLARVVGPLLGGLFYSLDFRLPFVGGAVLSASAFFLLIPLHKRLMALNGERAAQSVATETN